MTGRNRAGDAGRGGPRRGTTTRRRFLAAVPLTLAGRPGPHRTGRVATSSDHGPGADAPAGFDPAVDGFGFQNWSTAVPTYPEHDHDAVTEEQVARAIRNRWDGPLERLLGVGVAGIPADLLGAIARQIYVAVNQQSATNGHCYGMVFTSQGYFEAPGSIPLDRASASEFTSPDEPVGEPAVSPVAREIDLFQNSQFLDFFAWVGRRAVVRPGWIDYRRQLDDLQAVLDAFGTAGITLVNTANRSSHQVLLTGYRTRPDGVSFAVYEPNRSAAQYRGGRPAPTIEVDTTGPRHVVRPYTDLGYDAFVFNRYDRIIAARRSAEPLESITPTRRELREHLLSLALFLVDADVELTVVGPDDRPLRRSVAPFMDRRRTEYTRMRSRYGASPGVYRAVVTGTSETEYTLAARAADLGGGLLDDRVTATIGPGVVHAYEVVVPSSPDGDGRIEPATGGWSRYVAPAGVGLGAAGLATGAYLSLREQRGRDRCDPDRPP